LIERYVRREVLVHAHFSTVGAIRELDNGPGEYRTVHEGSRKDLRVEYLHACNALQIEKRSIH